MRRGLWRTGVVLAGLVALGASAPADEFSPFLQPRYRDQPAPTSLPGGYFPRGVIEHDLAAETDPANDLRAFDAAGAGAIPASFTTSAPNAPNTGASGERAPQSAPLVPNYHQELFGTPRPSSRPAAPAAQPLGVPQRLQPRQLANQRPIEEADSERSSTVTTRNAAPDAGGPWPNLDASADELIPADFRSDRHQGGIRRILAAEADESPFGARSEFAAPEFPGSNSPAFPGTGFSSADPFSGPPVHRAATTTAGREGLPDVLVPPLPAPASRPPAPFAPAAERPPLVAARPAAQPAAQASALVSPPLTTGAEHSEPQFPAVTLKWIKKGEMLVGQECACELIVRNEGQATAADVVVEAHFPPTVRMLESQPPPAEAATHLVWRFESLAPAAEHRIQLKLLPSRRGTIEPRALVRFTQGAVSRFSIDEPLLEVALKGPNEVSLGDPASQIVLVSNPGTGTVRNVTVLAQIPPGLENPNGNKLALDIGSLGPGETRRVRLGLAAARGGKHTLSVEATAASGLRHATTADVTVISPSLKLEVAGPGLRYKGRRATYEITVINDGTAPSNNVRVTHHLPEGFQFVRAEGGGFHDGSKRTVEWFIDRIEAGKSHKLSVELAAVNLGEFVHRVVATSEQGVRAEQELAATVDGTPSLVLEVVDLDDPVEVGIETGYEVRVRNEGSRAATNVALSCELPQGVELIEARGPADSSVQNGVIFFRPIPALEDGKTAIYRITVRGTSAGQHRFRALLASDSMTRPLAVEELTRFYGE